MGARKLKQYTEAERRRAVERAGEVGPAAAARELGLPRGTVSCWASLARKGATNGDKIPSGLDRASVEQATEVADDTESRGEGTRRSKDGTESTASVTSGTTPSGSGRANPRAARRYTPSERAQALERADEVGVTQASRELGMTRFSIQEWRRKARQHAEGQRGDSPVVGSDEDPADERDRRILEMWRRQPGLGPSQIRNQLRREGLKVSVHTVRRVMEDDGYRPPKTRRREVDDEERWEAVRPNQLWHLDFLHRYVHKQKIHVLLILDDFSRFIVGHAIWESERAEAAVETFEAAVARHGRPEAVLADGGSAFWSWRGVAQFTQLLEEYGVDQHVARRPQANGKLEVLNANVQKELFDVEHFFDLAETRRRLDNWVEFYNLRRTHHALGGLLVPADRYFGRADRVLAAVEAGGTPEGVGVPAPLGARLLDLLRVSSQGGRVEVHLMGQRLWPPEGR